MSAEYLEEQKRIRDYLLANPDYFTKENNQCCSINDVEFFGIANHKRIIRYGERFIVDLVGRQYWVVELSKKKHKTPDGSRQTCCKPLFCVSDDVERDFDVLWRNGYFIIPGDIEAKNHFGGGV